MLRYWLSPEELTMYQLQGYIITMAGGVDGTRRLFARSLFECTLDGKRHREDGPAVIYTDGTMCWYRHGNVHREDGPARCLPEGDVVWCQHGNPHRDDAPAIIYNDGEMWWYQNGNRHREDGPAFVHPDGSLEWWLDGDHYQTREDWLAELEKRRGTC